MSVMERDQPDHHCARVERAVRYLIIVSGSFVVTNHHWVRFMSMMSGDGHTSLIPASNMGVNVNTLDI